MKIEFGAWITTYSLFLFSLLLYKNIYVLIFWIPLLSGLIAMDFKKGIDKIALLISFIFSIISILIFYYFIIPYAFFLLVYIFKNGIFKRSYLKAISGLVGMILNFYLTSIYFSHNTYLYSIFLFLFMVGSEFTVRSIIRKNSFYLLYNIIPIFFIFLNPMNAIFSLSLVRIPLGIKRVKIKWVGITESLILIVLLTISLIIYKPIFQQL